MSPEGLVLCHMETATATSLRAAALLFNGAHYLGSELQRKNELQRMSVETIPWMSTAYVIGCFGVPGIYNQETLYCFFILGDNPYLETKEGDVYKRGLQC